MAAEILTLRLDLNKEALPHGTTRLLTTRAHLRNARLAENKIHGHLRVKEGGVKYRDIYVFVTDD